MSAFRLDSRAFGQGFKAVIPLWLAAAPVALAYTISARQAGFSRLEIQAMSLTVYSAAAQLTMVQGLSADTSSISILLAAVVLNLHHLLYGVSLSRRIALSPSERAIGAYFLTDAAYAATVAANQVSYSFLFGVELSLFLAWNVFTVLGMGFAVVPAWAQVDFVAPLTFFVLLVSTVKTRLEVGVAVISTLAALLCLSLQMGGLTVLVAGVVGAIAGVWLCERRQQPHPLVELDEA